VLQVKRTLLAALSVTTMLTPMLAGENTSGAAPAVAQVAAVDEPTLATCASGGKSSYLSCNKNPHATFVMKSSDGYYYGYSTPGDEAHPVWRSADLVTWEEMSPDPDDPDVPPYNVRPWRAKDATNIPGGGGTDKQPVWVDPSPDPPRAGAQYWPQEVIQKGDRYYMFYSAVASEQAKPNVQNCGNNHFIGLAVSESPTGPFVDIGRTLMDGTNFTDASGTPWKNIRTVDPNPFIDPVTGTAYLYFVKPGQCYQYNGHGESRIYVAELEPGLRNLASAPMLLLKPSQDQWEYDSDDDDNWKNEAPQMLFNPKNEKYYLMYSAGGFMDDKYAIGYAKGDSPTTGFTKYSQNPIIETVDGLQKSGHNHIIYSPDGRQIYTSYNTAGPKFLSRIGFRADNTLYANGPYATVVPKTVDPIPIELRVAPKPSGAPRLNSSGVLLGTVRDHASEADLVSVSSELDELRHSRYKLIDGETNVQPISATYGWQAAATAANPWVNLHWDTARSVDVILIYPPGDSAHAVSTGILQLSNSGVNSTPIDVVFPSQDLKAPAVINLTSRATVTDLTFTVTAMVDGASSNTAGLSDISVLGPPIP
jgi:hypothetical protein